MHIVGLWGVQYRCTVLAHARAACALFLGAVIRICTETHPDRATFKASTQGFSELQAFRSAEDNKLTNTRSY